MPEDDPNHQFNYLGLEHPNYGNLNRSAAASSKTTLETEMMKQNELGISPVEKIEDKSKPKDQKQSIPWLNVYPNPADEQLKILAYSSENAGNYKLVVRNMFGATINELNFNGVHEMSTAHLSEGVYYLQCSTHGGLVGVAKVVVIHKQ